MLFLNLVLGMDVHVHLDMPADKCCLYAVTGHRTPIRRQKISQTQLNVDLTGHLKLLIFNDAKTIMHSTAKLVRYENQFLC